MKAAIMGYGTIGSGVAEILKVNKGKIEEAAGEEISLKYVLDLRESLGDENNGKLIHDFSVIEADDEVGLVVETMGGLHPAYEFVKASLLKGKHVATSNKALVAAFGTELLQIAADNNCNFFFEASVGGGIPIIRPLYGEYMGEVLTEITGILNGTTNYILTRMKDTGAGFAESLKEAQDLGYAERDPSADVEGHDTCRKLAILLSLASGKEVSYEDIYTEGITKITDVDFRYADLLGMSIKLLGSAQRVEDANFAYVAPFLIGKENPLFMVSDVYNAIKLNGNCLGTTMHYGSGAGRLPTASAVVADLITAVRHKEEHVAFGWKAEKAEIEPMSSNAFRYFLRCQGDWETVQALVQEHFGTEETTLKRIQVEGVADEFGFVTDTMFEEEFLLAKEAFEKAADRELLQFIRIGL